MNRRLRSLSCFLTLAVLAACSTDAVARASHKPQQAKKSHEATRARHHRNVAHEKAGHKHSVAGERKSTRSSDIASADTSALSGDLAAVKNAIDLARKAKTSEATVIQKTIGDRYKGTCKLWSRAHKPLKGLYRVIKCLSPRHAPITA